MDIFYYWQKLESNLKNREVGYFGSNNSKLTDLAGRLPKRIWVRGGLTRSDSLLRFLSGTSGAVMLPI